MANDKADSNDEVVEELLRFLYLTPVGIIRFAANGTVDFINPVASQILLPLGPQGSLDNLYAALSSLVPDLGALVATTRSDNFDPEAFVDLWRNAGLGNVAVSGHRTIHLMADAETLWQGGMVSMVVTAGTVVAQDAAAQGRVRGAIARRAEAY